MCMFCYKMDICCFVTHFLPLGPLPHFSKLQPESETKYNRSICTILVTFTSQLAILQQYIWTDSLELFKLTNSNAFVICYNYHGWWIQSHHKSNKHRCTQTDQHVVWKFLEHTFGSVCFSEINGPWIDSLPLCSLVLIIE